MADPVGVKFLPLIPIDAPARLPTAPTRPGTPVAPAPAKQDSYTSTKAAPVRGIVPANAAFDHDIFNSIWIPPGAVKPNGKVDVVFHLHGSEGIHYRQMGLNAVVVSIQPKGKGLSDLFTKHYQASGGFNNWEKQLKAYLKQAVGTDQIDRIAVSSFSAGFAGVRPMLADPAIRDKIDSVFLLDSLHTGNDGLRPDAPGLKPFVDFARQAAQGNKLMVVTHSEIDPISYASTTKTANVLIQATGAVDHAYTGQPSPIQQQLTDAEIGYLHVMGFQGNDAPAHMKQLHMADELWPQYLMARWNAPPATEPEPPAAQGHPAAVRFQDPRLFKAAGR